MVATSVATNPSLQTLIQWLQQVVHRPPLPECPREAARTGKEPKQPAFISSRDHSGHARVTPITWKLWADPEVKVTEDEIKLWWADSATGLGTLGGWNGQHYICWIDVDLKGFSSQEECDLTVEDWLDQCPVLRTAHRFRSQSGGYRILVACQTKPEGFGTNSKFSLEPGGKSVGELLSGLEGRAGHTVLPPTRGMKGDYYWEQWSSDYPLIVESIADVGIYPAQSRKPKSRPVQSGGGSDLEKALTCLQSLSEDISEDYSSWLKVGMACHQISHEAGDPEALLEAWRNGPDSRLSLLKESVNGSGNHLRRLNRVMWVWGL